MLEGDIVHCILDFDGKQTVNFKFGLNNPQDNPLDITNRLVCVLFVFVNYFILIIIIIL